MKRNVTVAVGALCLAAAGWTMAYGQDRPTQRPVTPPPSPTRPQMEQPSTGGAGAGSQAMNEVCPVGIEGLQAQVVTIPEGGALQLTVAQSEVPELRSRMQRFQQIHQQNAQQRQRSGATGSGTGASGSMGSGSAGGGGASAGATPPPTGGSGSMGATGGSQQMQHFADESALIHQAQAIRVVEIPNGVRLEVTQLPSAQLQALRTELRQTAQQLTQGRCPLALQIEA